jgi:hypothetical protein
MVLWPENTMDVYVDQKWKFVGSTINMMEDEIKLLASGLGALCYGLQPHTTTIHSFRCGASLDFPIFQPIRIPIEFLEKCQEILLLSSMVKLLLAGQPFHRSLHLDYVSDLRVFRILVCLSASAKSGMAGEVRPAEATAVGKTPGAKRLRNFHFDQNETSQGCQHHTTIMIR